jgi:hypothetical protein
MEAIRSSETSGTTQRTTRRHIPEEDTLQNHHCENLKSYIILICLPRLLRTTSTISLFPEHKTALLMQCAESITEVLFHDIFLIADAVPVSCY